MIPDVPLLSLPVPMYLPSPTPSYRLFKPRAVPIPVPFFVPVMIPVPRKAYMNIRDYLQVKQSNSFMKNISFIFANIQTQRDLLPDDPFQAALILHAESLVRAENRPAETINTSQEPVIMMDITRDGLFLYNTSMHSGNVSYVFVIVQIHLQVWFRQWRTYPNLILKHITLIRSLRMILKFKRFHFNCMRTRLPCSLTDLTNLMTSLQLLRMLPDASDRLKWTYGVEAFQRWAKQRNQAFLNAPHEGK